MTKHAVNGGATAKGTPYIMGIVNVTPDSFSDGSTFFAPDAAIAHGLELVAQGAHIIDIGGESTRPGATRIDPLEEQRRVLPVVTALCAEGIRVSIDTMNANTAALAIEAGAVIVNDVSGGLADTEMATVISGSEVTFVAMHWRTQSEKMYERSHYTNAAENVRDELNLRIDALTSAGIRREQLIVDPGLGFSKQGDTNWQVLQGIGLLSELGLPILIGASRKRFLAELIPDESAAGELAPARDEASSMVALLAATHGVWGVRVHNVRSTVTAFNVYSAWQNGHHRK